MQINTTAATARPMITRPPTTPPTIGPAGVPPFELGVVATDEVVEPLVVAVVFN
jgi:hypothetical protein